ncbi:DCP2-domain-containing protein, partial [Gymnopus androsaceus JB14]
MSSSSSSSPEIPSAAHTDPSQGRFSSMYESQEDVLEDLTSRFILNLPDEELNSLERISFQVEQAHWFYEDFVREANPRFPSLPLKKFSAMLFDACPLLHRWEDHDQAFTDFMQYKTRVPVCGAIMLNDSWEKCVLVKGWKSSSGWGFPKGKINEDEPQPNCAIREVLEETGYNLASQLNPEHSKEFALYIVPGVPEDYPFKTKTRKEISKIEWFRLADLPTWKRNKTAPGKFYLITPFIGALKQFIREHKPSNVPRKNRNKKAHNHESRPASRHQLSIADSPSTSSQEANQESSSQSSSTDPQTPSPQSISTAANHVDIVHPETLDPHFARLLSGLTLSGMAAPSEVIHKPVPPKSPVPPAPLSVSVPESPSEVIREPSPPVSDVSSTIVPGSTSTLEVNPVGQTTQALSFPRNAPISSSPRTTSNSLQSPPLSASDAAASPSTSPVRPFRATSRRTSSTADISPYLARTTEIPSSAKRLKQIALLEAVANESARMSPILQIRDAAVNGALKEHVTRYSQPVHPAQYEHNVLYSSGPMGMGGRGFPPPPVPGHLPMHDDAFVVRPRTSQAVHRAPYGGVPSMPGSMSMTHSQLSALMNPLPRASPAIPQMLPGPAQYRFPPPPPGYPPFVPASSSRDGAFFPVQHRSVPLSPGSVPPLSHQLPVPLSAPALSPVFNIPPPPGQSQGLSAIPNNHLLSILNGNMNAPPGTF